MSKRYLAALVLLVSISFPAQSQQPATSPSPTPPPGETTAQPQNPAPQDPDETDVVRIRTNLVQVDAVVTRDGKQVKDLTADDFEIFEDDRKQVITNFSYVSNQASAPSETIAKPAAKRGPGPVVPPAIRPENPHRTIALVVDDLGISAESIASLKGQLRKFIDEQMQPNDLVAIIRTGGEVGALQQFTTDRRLLNRSVEKLRRNPCSRVGTTVLTPVSPLSLGNNISLCAQDVKATARALRFIIQGMSELPGRKSMVVLSDSLPVIPEADPLLEPGTSPTTEARNDVPRVGGVEPVTATSDRGSTLNNEAALKRIAELAIRASVVIYGIDTSGLQPIGISAVDSFPILGAPGTGTMSPQSVMNQRSRQLENARTGMELIAKETGGFHIRNSNDFQLQRVLSDQEGYYLIGYRPAEGTFNRKFHHIRARVKGPGLTVRTRAGFFGVTDEEARPERTSRDKINMALMSPFSRSDIEVQLTSLFANTAEKGSLLRSFLYFQAKDLTFTEEADGWRQAIFDLSGMIFGDNGSVAHQTSETRTLRLRGKAYEQAQRRGLVYLLDVPVPKPGAYQFRVAVRDAGSSRIGTAGQFVEVPDLKKDRLTLSGLTISGLTDSNASDEAKSDSSTTTAGDLEAMSSPAQRRFRTPSNLYFGYIIYNAQLDKTTQKPKLTTSIRLLRETLTIFDGQPKMVDLTDQMDMGRISGGGGLLLGTEMKPGQYVLQIIVTDHLANEERRTATQWIDFEIMK